MKHWNKGYSRIYFGNEFCQKLLPAVNELEEILNFVSSNNLNFSFVTCYVTNQGLERIECLLEKLSQIKPGSEIVINDWGVLEICQRYKLKPVLGRLLAKQKRDPRILNLIDKLPDTMAECFKEASIGNYFAQFLKEKGVERIEIDNLLQGIKINENKSIALLFSLYIPFGYIATSRICFSKGYYEKINKTIEFCSCGKKCRDYSFSLRHPSMPIPLFLKGNTIFFKNHKMPTLIDETKINRIVYQPTIPV